MKGWDGPWKVTSVGDGGNCALISENNLALLAGAYPFVIVYMFLFLTLVRRPHRKARHGIEC